MEINVVLRYLICLVLLPTGAIAAAWTLPEDLAQHIVTYRYYSTDQFFDARGKKQDKRGHYRKHEAQYYGEYGVTDRITTGLSLIASREKDIPRIDAFDLNNASSAETISISGLTRSDVFARYQLYRDNRNALSVQGTVTMPALYTEELPNTIVKDDWAGEIALSAGRNFAWLGQYHFVDLQAGYRYRRGILGNQINMQATLGLRPYADWLVLAQWRQTAAVGGINYAATTITGQNDHDLTVAQLSLAHNIHEQVTLEVGGFSHIDGRNTGAGGGGMVSVWLRF